MPLAKSAGTVSEPFLGIPVLGIIGIHTAGCIKELLSIHVVTAIDRHTSHKEVPFGASLGLGDRREHLSRLGHPTQIDELASGDIRV